AGPALDWGAAGLDRGGLGLRPDDDLGGQASPGQSDRHALRQRGEADAEGDERLGDRGPSSAFAGEVVRRDPRNPERSAGRLASFKSLRCRYGLRYIKSRSPIGTRRAFRRIARKGKLSPRSGTRS